MKKRDWIDSRLFTRFLEIITGATAWTLIISPVILAPIAPVAAAYFILAFNFYWVVKAFNIMRHMLKGFDRMWKIMKVDWLKRCQMICKDPAAYKQYLWKEYEKNKNKTAFLDWQEIENLEDNYSVVKNWRDIYHVIFVTNCFEDFYITEPTYDAIRDCNYPNDRIIVVSCGEGRDIDGYKVVKEKLAEKFGKDFLDIQYYVHDFAEGEVIGKGPNLASAGHKFMKYFNEKYPHINSEDVIVTNLDADHIIHQEYLANITYKYIIDTNRDRKTYQPIPLLFNNIWDSPAPSRVLAIASSFWQIVEAMRPYRLRTFAAHTQSLKTLLVTDFWSNKTVVEDGHQYWRTYFAFNGDHEMVPIFIPIYQDCVLAEDFWTTLKNQYKQRRRWAWGVSDFPFIVKNFIRHNEIPLGEKILQSFRHFAGNISWSAASFLIAFSWIPLAFNNSFQDTVLAQNVSVFSSNMLALAWIGVIANVWIFMFLLPPLPKNKRKTDYIGMLLQWVISPFVAIAFSALPALESQTRYMFGNYLDVFWVTPKVRVRRDD